MPPSTLKCTPAVLGFDSDCGILLYTGDQHGMVVTCPPAAVDDTVPDQRPRLMIVLEMILFSLYF